MNKLMVMMAFVMVACSGSEEATTETTSGTETETTSETTVTAETWAPSECTTYGFTPTDCEGSPENPSCHSEFTLRPDGSGDILFDDIMATLSFTVDGDQVRVTASQFDYNETYTVVDGGAAMLDAQGNRYEASACQ